MIMIAHCFTRFARTACVIALAATLVGCAGSGGSSGSASASGPSGVASASVPADPKEAILQGYRQMKNKSYRLRETTTMSGPRGASTFTRVAEFVPPNASHAITEGYESISIGDDHYEKVDGKWLR